jgi:hypothetical protein
MLGVRSNGDRAFDIDPPTSSYAIMRRARSYRGENSEPGKDIREELASTPGIREQHRPEATLAAARETRLDAAADPRKFDILRCGPGREGAIN